MKDLKRWQAFVLVALFLASGGGVYSWRISTATAGNGLLSENSQLVAVQYGNVIDSVSASGSLSFANKADLTFGGAGTVTEVSVNQGDSVTTGQVLARIDDSSLSTLKKNVTQARINLKNAEDSLEAAMAPPYSESDIAKAETSVSNAETSAKTAEDNLANAQHPYTDLDIAQAELNVANARASLKMAQDNLDKSRNPYTASDFDDAEAAIATARQQLADAETKAVLDVADSEYSVYKADLAYATALDKWARLEITYEDLLKSSRDMERAKLNLESTRQNAAKSVNDARDRLAVAEETLAEMSMFPDALEVEQKQKSLAVATASLARAEVTLADMLAGPVPADVEAKQRQLDTAWANLAESRQILADMKAAGPDPLVAELRAIDVEIALAALKDAESRIDGAYLIAPFDGVVSALGIKVGQNVTGGTAAVSVVDTSSPQVDAAVSETDISRVRQGQVARVSLDGLPGVLVSGTVSTVAVSGRSTSGVVSYPVTVQVTAPRGATLREGMTATVTLVVEQASSVLVVPNRAIGGTVGNPTVTVVANGASVAKPVVLGLSDDSRTQVMSGLNAGEMVMVIGASSSSQERFFGGGAAGAFGRGAAGGLDGGVIPVVPGGR